MDWWKRSAMFTLALIVAATAHAHAPDEGPSFPKSSDASEMDPHAGESWFSSLKHNETEKDVQDEQEQLEIQRTTASLSCASPQTLAALDRKGEMLDVRMAIAMARRKRDQARKTGKPKLAEKLERKIHRAKLQLLELATQPSSETAEQD